MESKEENGKETGGRRQEVVRLKHVQINLETDGSRNEESKSTAWRYYPHASLEALPLPLYLEVLAEAVGGATAGAVSSGAGSRVASDIAAALSTAAMG